MFVAGGHPRAVAAHQFRGLRLQPFTSSAPPAPSARRPQLAAQM